MAQNGSAPKGRLFQQIEGSTLTPSSPSWDEPLPLGPVGLLTGVLPNGLTYYVRKAAKPAGRAALALVVRVGSVVEEEHERGLAHMVEHLAFNATDKFSNHAIVKHLEKIGAQFGACQNAFTSADETVYQLVVPTDKDPSVLQETLDVLSQFAFAIRCAPEDVAKEKGAVMEELRMGLDATGRAQQAHWRLLLQGCRYAERLPIGLESVVKGPGAAAAAKAFYEKWYRPEHMAVVIVGDMGQEPSAVVELIRGAFTGCSRDLSPCPPVPSYSYMPHAEPRLSVHVDREASSPSVYVSFKTERASLSSPKDYLAHLEEWMFSEVLNTRYYKLSREAEPPFASASMSEEPLTASCQTIVLSASAMEGCVLQALEALLTEAARIRAHGISDREFAHAIKDLQSDIENTWKEQDQGYSWDIRDEYMRHFLNNEFVVGAKSEAQLSKGLLGLVTKERVEAMAVRLATNQSCVVKVVGHRKEVTEAEVAAVMAAVAEREAQGAITLWEGDAALPDSLLANEPTELTLADAILEEKHYAELGATEWQLCNGMTVLYKATDFRDDEVLLTGVAVGGLSQVQQAHHYAAVCSNVVAGHLGAFGLKPSTLNDFLAGTRVEISCSEGAYSRSFNGSQSPEDLETALQLVYALFATSVAPDTKELAVISRLLHEGVESSLRNPLAAYRARCRAVNYSSLWYFRPMDHQDVSGLDMQLACTHHNVNFSNPAAFKLALTGTVSREQLLPLVCKYLATIPRAQLPVPRSLAEVTPLVWSPPAHPVVEDVVVGMVSPICQATLTLPATLERSKARKELMWLGLACRILENRLLAQMRFISGDVYTVNVGSFFGCEAPSSTGDARGDVAIGFTCDPPNRQKLFDIALKEVDSLQAGGVTEEELRTVVHLEQLSLAEGEAENSYWHELVVSAWQSKSYLQTGCLDEVYKRTTTQRDEVFATALTAAGPAEITAIMCKALPHPCRSCYTALAMVPQPPSLLHRLVTALQAPLQMLSGGTDRKLLVSGAGLVLTGVAGVALWLLFRRKRV